LDFSIVENRQKNNSILFLKFKFACIFALLFDKKRRGSDGIGRAVSEGLKRAEKIIFAKKVAQKEKILTFARAFEKGAKETEKFIVIE